MRLTERVHHYLNTQLKPGDHAIDATAGNGHDAAHMASLVGPKGQVIAIDIQKAAIDTTRERLNTRGCSAQVQLLTGEHSSILQSLCSKHAQTICAITFNLGYLPGSDKHIRTTPETTLRALDASRQLLNPKGLLLVTAYRGHEGGQAEANAVAGWMETLQAEGCSVESYTPATQGTRTPPILWIMSLGTSSETSEIQVSTR